MLLLGPFADNFERKKFIAFGNLVKFFIWLLIVILLVLNKLNIATLSIFYMINSIGGAIINAGSAGFLPELVARKHIQKAFAAITATNSVTNILGGISAGIIVNFLGIIFSSIS